MWNIIYLDIFGMYTILFILFVDAAVSFIVDEYKNFLQCISIKMVTWKLVVYTGDFSSSIEMKIVKMP